MGRSLFDQGDKGRQFNFAVAPLFTKVSNRFPKRAHRGKTMGNPRFGTVLCLIRTWWRNRTHRNAHHGGSLAAGSSYQLATCPYRTGDGSAHNPSRETTEGAVVRQITDIWFGKDAFRPDSRPRAQVVSDGC